MPHDMAEERRPWLPACLAAHRLTVQTVTELSYVFLDEVGDDSVDLVVHPWPWADPWGRVRFDAGEEQLELVVDREVLTAQLYRGFRRRDPRPGDAFAATIRRDLVVDRVDPDGVLRGRLSDVIEGPVYDVSAEARTVAKLAYFASLATVVPPARVGAWGLATGYDESARPAPVRTLGEQR